MTCLTYLKMRLGQSESFFGVVQKPKFKHILGGEGGLKTEIRNSASDKVLKYYFSIYPVNFSKIVLSEPRKPAPGYISGRKDSVS